MKYIPLLLVCVLISCTSGNKQQASTIEANGVAVINLSENVSDASSLPLSDAVAKVEFVCLEATNEALTAGIHLMQVTDHDIWIAHYKDNRILRFSRSGKFLNMVGNIGQGPGEYVTLGEFFIDENHKEVYIVGGGVLVYDFEGNFKRNVIGYNHYNKFAAAYMQHALFENNFFIAQNIALYRPVPIDSLWSFALVDSCFHLKKMFKNPAHIGREEGIIKNCAQMNNFANYWKENLTNIDTYGNQLTLKYPDTDTIYRYDIAHESLNPQYSIFTKEEKGDYEQTHLWFRERKAFDYFSISSYYPSKDYVYLVGSKGDKVLTYCYNKQDGTVREQKRQGEIKERQVPWFNIPLRRIERPFVLDNDLLGGEFTVDYRSAGKYWIDVLEPFSEDNWIDIGRIKATKAKDEAKKKELVEALENVGEESNPIVLIVTLK